MAQDMQGHGKRGVPQSNGELRLMVPDDHHQGMVIDELQEVFEQHRERRSRLTSCNDTSLFAFADSPIALRYQY